jgi:hypothetical protein
MLWLWTDDLDALAILTRDEFAAEQRDDDPEDC